MSDKDLIEVGDLVSVDFNSSNYTLTIGATVLKMPCATGDSWVFKDQHDGKGKVYYVSEGCTITLMQKG